MRVNKAPKTSDWALGTGFSLFPVDVYHDRFALNRIGNDDQGADMHPQIQLFFTMTRWELLRMLRAEGMIRRAVLGLGVFIGWLVLTAATLGWMFQWPVMILLLSLFPLVLLLGYIADSFAGERERGTLETLLLSPVPDWMIIGSKIAALEIVALLVSATLLLAHALTANLFGIRSLAPGWYIFAWYIAATVAVIMICFGLIVSWSVASVQAAQQLFAYIVVGLSLGMVLYGYLPAGVVQFTLQLITQTKLSWFAAAGAGLAVASCIIVVALFRRERLLLR